MIKIRNSNLINISSEYLSRVKDWLHYNKKNKTNKNTKDRIVKIINDNTEVDSKYKEMLNFFHDGINNKNIILLKNKKEFDEIIDVFTNQFNNEIQLYDHASGNNKKNTAFGKFTDKMEEFYKNFFKDSCELEGYKDHNNGGWLTKKLNVQTCPYCNRQYTFTINKKDLKIRPQLDHFYPKFKYPYFALSFYNLIPSCPICNFIKGENLVNINPYWENFQDNNCRFVLIDENILRPAIIDKKNIKIGFNFDHKKNIKGFKHKCEDNIDVFGLRELYDEHVDYVEEIIDKAQAYNSACYDSLIKSFSGLSATHTEIDRYIWGNYIELADQYKRPLSKLTRGILEQIGIINNE
jgi:hypothetical protein